jgi:hypothetical protein
MKCFVIMPFGNPEVDAEQAHQLELIYSEWIKPAVESIRYNDTEHIECHRADKALRPDEIVSHIVENLVSADIVIADLSGRNANVFYELGVRHAVNNNTILIADNLSDVPFDLRALRTIVYGWDPEQMVRLKRFLEQAISEILREPKRIDNPVRRFLYDREVEKLIKETIPPGYDALKDIIAEVGSLRREVKAHLAEVRDVMKLITSKDATSSLTPAQKFTLHFFEGAWTSVPTGSMYYARVVDDELYMPYCYGADKELTGHYFNLRVIDDTLVGRFQWLNGSGISGYALNKVKSHDLLSGAWWYAEDVPDEILGDVSKIHLRLPRKNTITFHRLPNREFPDWAEEYFQLGLYKRTT